MELWTIAVITVECAAQIFYQALKDATDCTLLKQICTDILIDEAAHITFQRERLYIIFNQKNFFSKWIAYHTYFCFFISTSLVVWFEHKTFFKAGKFKLGKVAGKSALYEKEEEPGLSFKELTQNLL
jgi:hypothetical protein